jgi:hypothetical protein
MSYPNGNISKVLCKYYISLCILIYISNYLSIIEFVYVFLGFI